MLIHRDSEHPDHDPWFRQRKPLQHYVEPFPIETVPFPSAIEPLKQQLLYFMTESRDSLRIIGYAVVVVMASQLGFGCFPKVLRLHRPGFLQPLLEGFQLGGELLAGCNPLHSEPFSVPARAAVVGQPQEIERLRFLTPPFGALSCESSKLHHSGLRRLHLKSKLAQPFPQFLVKPLRFLLLREAHDEVVGVTDQSGKGFTTLEMN